jgi:hypothetical protein
MLDYDVNLYDSGTLIWTGSVNELVTSNDDFDVKSLESLEKPGDRVTVGGGASDEFEVERIA